MKITIILLSLFIISCTQQRFYPVNSVAGTDSIYYSPFEEGELIFLKKGELLYNGKPVKKNSSKEIKLLNDIYSYLTFNGIINSYKDYEEDLKREEKFFKEGRGGFDYFLILDFTNFIAKRQELENELKGYQRSNN